jgi:hypothetical protein
MIVYLGNKSTEKKRVEQEKYKKNKKLPPKFKGGSLYTPL